MKPKVAGLLCLLCLSAPAQEPADDDIRGPRAPVEIPVPEEFSIVPWLIVAGVLAVIVLLLWWWKMRGGKAAAASALNRALHDLTAVDRERNQLDAGPLADKAAGVVRRFIAERFGIAAPQRTTEEFLRSLTDAPPLGAHADLLRSFLQSCDAAKFAGVSFDAAERHALLEAAFRFVRSAGDQPPPAS